MMEKKVGVLASVSSARTGEAELGGLYDFEVSLVHMMNSRIDRLQL